MTLLSGYLCQNRPVIPRPTVADELFETKQTCKDNSFRDQHEKVFVGPDITLPTVFFTFDLIDGWTRFFSERSAEL